MCEDPPALDSTAGERPGLFPGLFATNFGFMSVIDRFLFYNKRLGAQLNPLKSNAPSRNFGCYTAGTFTLGNLRGAFGRLGRAHPIEEGTPLPDMIESVTKQPLDDLKGAIDRRDDADFGKAYDGLSDACNSCHQALNHGTVVIARPTGAFQSDLVFGKAGR